MHKQTCVSLCCCVTIHTDLISHNCTGTITEGPSNVTYIPGVTPLPIELTCNVTGLAAWRVNGLVTVYTLAGLTNGALPGHNRSGANILVNSPVNNTEYICVSQTFGGEDESNPAYIVISGEFNINTLSFLILMYAQCVMRSTKPKGN